VNRTLIIADGRRERRLLLVSSIVIGRDPTCDVSDDDDALLSRRHVEFSVEGHRVTVRDLGSRNGTFVNGARVAETALHSGDLVRVGRLRVQFVDDTAAAAGDPVVEPPSSGPQPALHAPAPTPAAASAEQTDGVPPASMSGDEVDGDERTMFVPVTGTGIQRIASAANEGTPMSALAVHGRPASPMAVQRPRPAAYVSALVTALTAIVFLAVAGAALLRPTSPGAGNDPADGPVAWLVPPLVIAVAAAYGVGRLINRRLARLAPAGEHRGEPVPEQRLDGNRGPDRPGR
jgi:hypothetical protein